MRWLDDVLEDLRRMYVRGYNEMTVDRRLWRRSVSAVVPQTFVE